MSAQLARVETIALFAPAFASLVLALRGLVCLCRAGRIDPVSLYVGKGQVIPAVGEIPKSPKFLACCDPSGRPENSRLTNPFS